MAQKVVVPSAEDCHGAAIDDVDLAALPVELRFRDGPRVVEPSEVLETEAAHERDEHGHVKPEYQAPQQRAREARRRSARRWDDGRGRRVLG
jgi:hypothetical protein